MRLLSQLQTKRSHGVKNFNIEEAAGRVSEIMKTGGVRIIRVLGKPEYDLTPVLKKLLSSASVLRSSILIENIYFDSEQGFLGWVSNALGLYEGAVAARGKVPAHLAEIIRLRAVKYLMFYNFQDAFYLRGVSKNGMATDINSLLLACEDLKIVVAQSEHHDDSEYTALLKYPVGDIRI
jgi:hypothetical protein